MISTLRQDDLIYKLFRHQSLPTLAKQCGRYDLALVRSFMSSARRLMMFVEALVAGPLNSATGNEAMQLRLVPVPFVNAASLRNADQDANADDLLRGMDAIAGQRLVRLFILLQRLDEKYAAGRQGEHLA